MCTPYRASHLSYRFKQDARTTAVPRPQRHHIWQKTQDMQTKYDRSGPVIPRPACAIFCIIAQTDAAGNRIGVNFLYKRAALIAFSSAPHENKEGSA
jgi:hypothetical protein